MVKKMKRHGRAQKLQTMLSSSWCRWLCLAKALNTFAYIRTTMSVCVEGKMPIIKVWFFGAQELWKKYRVPCLMVRPPSDCLDSIMDCFSDVCSFFVTGHITSITWWPWSPQYGRTHFYMRSPYNYGSVGPSNTCNQLVVMQEWHLTIWLCQLHTVTPSSCWCTWPGLLPRSIPSQWTGSTEFCQWRGHSNERCCHGEVLAEGSPPERDSVLPAPTNDCTLSLSTPAPKITQQKREQDKLH